MQADKTLMERLRESANAIHTSRANHRLLSGAITALEASAAREAEYRKQLVDAVAEAEKLRGEVARLNNERESADGMDGAVVHAIRELLYAAEVPKAAFIDDHVANAIVQRNQERDRAEAAEARIAALVAGLKPFAKLAADFDARGFEADEEVVPRLLIGDLREARRLLEDAKDA